MGPELPIFVLNTYTILHENSQLPNWKSRFAIWLMETDVKFNKMDSLYFNYGYNAACH
jgi:hypothetical protein